MNPRTPAILCLGASLAGAHAAPVVEPWPLDGSVGASAVSASALSGVYAVASTANDAIEIRDIRGELQRRIERNELVAFLPWMTLSADGDGPSAVALSDSGRLLFVAVHDDEIVAQCALQRGGCALCRARLADREARTLAATVGEPRVHPQHGHLVDELALECATVGSNLPIEAHLDRAIGL